MIHAEHLEEYVDDIDARKYLTCRGCGKPLLQDIEPINA
jgi:hypothetical protein